MSPGFPEFFDPNGPKFVPKAENVAKGKSPLVMLVRGFEFLQTLHPLGHVFLSHRKAPNCYLVLCRSFPEKQGTWFLASLFHLVFLRNHVGFQLLSFHVGKIRWGQRPRGCVSVSSSKSESGYPICETIGHWYRPSESQ